MASKYSTLLLLLCIFFMVQLTYEILKFTTNNKTVETLSATQSAPLQANLSFPEYCLSAMEGISLLPSFDNPETQSIRSTILQHNNPPYLISYGGSGNTFIRLLIEYVSKIYTGSLYTGEFKREGYVGSDYCSTETIVVKFHGEHMSADTLDAVLKGETMVRTKKQNISLNEFRKFNGNLTANAIFIVRDPWNAMFALFNYWQGNAKGAGNRHRRHVLLNGYNMTKFLKFLKKNKGMAAKWNRNIEVMNLFKANNKSFLMVKFENIVSSDHSIRTNELLSIMKYLYRKEYYELNEDLFKYRINCVWNISKTDLRMDSIHRSKPDVNELNKTFAWRSLGAGRICELWKNLQPHASMFGYKIWNNVSCD